MGIQTVNQTWQLRVACRGRIDVVLPPSASERKEEREAWEARAKLICSTCAVREPCLDYAVETREPHGIWGGLNEHERRELLAARSA